MSPEEIIKKAVDRCAAVPVQSLEEFLGSLLDEDLEMLAQMPGTPGQVLANQFCYYVRSSVPLSEALRRDSKNAQKLLDICRQFTPQSRKRKEVRE